MLCGVLTCVNAVGQSFPAGQVTFRQFASVNVPDNRKAMLEDQTKNSKCSAPTAADKSGSYTYPAWFPLWWKGCHSDLQVQNFFKESGPINAGEAAKYLYNAQQSASVINADLLTATFQPGLQAVLAGSATSGSGNSTSNSTPTSSAVAPRASGSTSSSTTSTSSDSVATAVSKLENGGDFNMRFPLPLLWTKNGSASVSGQLTPNLGFSVNGLSAQNTITDSTQYTLNIPLEFYGQLASTQSSSTPAVLFLDVKPAG